MSRGKTAKGLATKQIEMRRCVVCRQVRHKSELLRVVKTSAGEIFIDEDQKLFGRGGNVTLQSVDVKVCDETNSSSVIKKVFGRGGNVTLNPVDETEICDETNSTSATEKIFGRGAYVCKSETCAAVLKKRHGLDKTFKCKVPADVYEKICAAVATDG